MAKVRYYNSPVSNTEFKEYCSTQYAILDILRELNIHDKPNLAVRIDGKSYKDLDLNLKVNDDSLVEIKHMVFGGSANDRNKGISTVIRIAAAVAATFFTQNPTISLLILTGGQLIAGAIRRAGFRDVITDNEDKTDAVANAFSLTSARNEARTLEPMSLVLGSHRMAPDFGSRPYSLYTGGGTPTLVPRRSDSIIGIEDNFSVNLPANWISSNVFNQFYWIPSQAGVNLSNWWPYPIRVQSNFNPSSFISNEVFFQQEVSGNYSRDYSNFTVKNDFLYETSSGNVTGKGPIIIEHYDLNDPVVIANGGQAFKSSLQLLMWAIYSQFKHAMFTGTGTGTDPSGFLSYTSDAAHGASQVLINRYQQIYLYLIGLYQSGMTPSQADAHFNALESTSGAFPATNLYRNKDQESPNDDATFFMQWLVGMTFGSTFNNNYSPEPYGVFGDLNSLSITDRRNVIQSFVDGLNGDSISVQGNFLRIASVDEFPKNQEVKHVMHYGLGDIEVLDRRVGDTPLEKINGYDYGLNTKQTTRWPIDNSRFISNVKTVDGADALNNDDFSGPETLESLSPDVDSNWITRETPDNCYKIDINIEGSSFESNDDGSYSLFGADFEIQYRNINDSLFTLYDGSYFLGSNKAEVVRKTIEIPVPNGRCQIRIRKRTLDPTDSKFVQSFKITGFNFYIDDTQTAYVAENREGLRLLATGSFNGTTQQYNSLVESKCWSYDGFNWSWEHTRNPAWWFLYYARGGFLNESADGSLTYPYSPTIGWLNSADHTNNLERMFGAGLSDSEIDIDRIIYWANFCDSKDLKLDMVIREDNNVHEFLERIANVGRASTSFYRGKLSVVIEDESQLPEVMYGMGNIIKDSFSVTYVTEDLPDKIIGTYSDRDQNWDSIQVESVVPNSTDENKIVEVSLPGVTEQQQAQREVNLIAARQLYQRRQYSWEVDTQGLLVRRGDLAYLSHDVTQYDQSGRVYSFVSNGTKITKIETPIELLDTTDIMISLPNGKIQSYKAHNEGKYLVLDEDFELKDAPRYLDGTNENENAASSFINSFPEDYIFFSGPKETPGKLVRISSISSDDDFKFKISAVEEEAAMYSYEYDQVYVPAEDESKIVSKIYNADYKDLGSGKIEIWWEKDAAIAAQIFDKSNPTVPIQANGSSTIYGQSVILELQENSTYNLIIEPVTVGTPYEKIAQEITVRS